MRKVHANKRCTAPFECLETVTVKTPKAGPGTILVRLNGSSVNPSDVDQEEAIGPLDPMGVDFAGEVVEVGAGVSDFKVGDHAWGYSLRSYADYVLVPAITAAQAPKSLDLATAGTIPEVGTTSSEALKRTGAPWDPKKNVTVVITSGSGGTGFIALQLARAYGAGTIITSTSGPDNIALCKKLGADIVVDYKVSDIFATLANDTVDVVFDNHGGKGEVDLAMPKIKTGGVFLLLPGGSGGTLSKHPKAGVTQSSFGLMVPDRKILDGLAALFDLGQLQPHVQHTYDFDHISDAFTQSVSGTTVGKLSVVPGPLP